MPISFSSPVQVNNSSNLPFEMEPQLNNPVISSSKNSNSSLSSPPHFFPQFWWLFLAGKLSGVWPFSLQIIKYPPEQNIYSNSGPRPRSRLKLNWFSALIPILIIVTAIVLLSVGGTIILGGTPKEVDDGEKKRKNRLAEQVGNLLTGVMVVFGVMYIRILNLVGAKKIRLFWEELDLVLHQILDLDLHSQKLGVSRKLLRNLKIKVNALLAISFLSGTSIIFQGNGVFKSVLQLLFVILSWPAAVAIGFLIIMLGIELFLHCIYFITMYAIVKTVSTAFEILKSQIENLEDFDATLIGTGVMRNNRIETLESHQNGLKTGNGNENFGGGNNHQKNKMNLHLNIIEPLRIQMREAPPHFRNDGAEMESNSEDGKVSNILKLASSLSDVFENFNQVFGRQLLAILWVMGIPMVFNLFLIFLNVWEGKYLDGFLSQTFTFLRNFIIFYVICNSGTEITDVSLEMANLLGKIGTQNMEEETKHVLHFYHRRTLGMPLSISPGSYLAFNNQLITSLYGAFVTYLAILIQFNSPSAIDGIEPKDDIK